MQLLAESITSNLTSFLQTTFQTAQPSGLAGIASHLDIKLKVFIFLSTEFGFPYLSFNQQLEEFLENDLGTHADELVRLTPDVKSIWTSRYLFISPRILCTNIISFSTLPTLSLDGIEPSQQEDAQKQHDAISHSATQIYEYLFALTRRMEHSKSPSEVRAAKKFLKLFKKVKSL